MKLSYFLKSYVKKSQDQKVNYEQEKKRLSPNDLQTVDAAEKARKIERRVKNVCINLEIGLEYVLIILEYSTITIKETTFSFCTFFINT